MLLTMHLEELITDSAEEYIQKATDIAGMDPVARDRVLLHLRASASLLYEDGGVLPEWERMLVALSKTSTVHFEDTVE